MAASKTNKTVPRVASGSNSRRTASAADGTSSDDQLKVLSPCKIVPLDMSDEASILQAAEELDGEVIDLLINNAGIYEVDTFELTTKASLLRQFEVNAIGPFLTTRAFALIWCWRLPRTARPQSPTSAQPWEASL